VRANVDSAERRRRIKKRTGAEASERAGRVRQATARPRACRSAARAAASASKPPGVPLPARALELRRHLDRVAPFREIRLRQAQARAQAAREQSVGRKELHHRGRRLALAPRRLDEPRHHARREPCTRDGALERELFGAMRARARESQEQEPGAGDEQRIEPRQGLRARHEQRAEQQHSRRPRGRQARAQREPEP
jgi:hypothetical protein